VTILGIETSCDETSAAIVRDGIVRSNIVSSQYFHSLYGGVVPELASRAHLRNIVPIIEKALHEAETEMRELNVVAATQGPGLIGSLLVGLNTGKAIAMCLGLPFIPVNHIEAHLLSPFLMEQHPAFPYIGLVVSGGHTLLVLVDGLQNYRLLGSTIDDAAGEAFDKVAKMLGLGFPGGPEIDSRARHGNAKAFDFPRPLLDEQGYRFSFSGLKTSVLYMLRGRATNGVLALSPEEIDDVCASFQRSVVDVLTGKLLRAAVEFNVHAVAVTGGVSANRELAGTLRQRCEEMDLRLHIPAAIYSTDNAAMVAMLASMKDIPSSAALHAPAFARLAGTLFHEAP